MRPWILARVVPNERPNNAIHAKTAKEEKQMAQGSACLLTQRVSKHLRTNQPCLLQNDTSKQLLMSIWSLLQPIGSNKKSDMSEPMVELSHKWTAKNDTKLETIWCDDAGENGRVAKLMHSSEHTPIQPFLGTETGFIVQQSSKHDDASQCSWQVLPLLVCLGS